jgi:4-hydroxybenzoate polyprenyltransferase
MTVIKNYLSLIKFSHTVFALPFALIGFFLGADSGAVSWLHNPNNITGWGTRISEPAFFDLNKGMLQDRFIAVILCMVFARSAAMAFNRYLDRSFDAQNPRTAIREIPAGVIKANSALLFTIAMSVLFVFTTFFINRLCFALSPVALLVVLGYSFTKRFTPLCHLVLGLGLSLAPIGAYLALTGKFDLLPVLFSFTVLFWVSGFDIIYALQDEEFDKKYQLKSIPAWLGKVRALRVSEALHVLSACSLLAAGWLGAFGIWYWVGVVFFIALLVYQHLLVKPHDLSKVNMAFFTTNGIASVLFAVFVIADILV